MKKNYMQPCVEAAQLQMGTMVMAGSPAGVGILGGGSSTDIPGGDLLVPGE